MHAVDCENDKYCIKVSCGQDLTCKPRSWFVHPFPDIPLYEKPEGQWPWQVVDASKMREGTPLKLKPVSVIKNTGPDTRALALWNATFGAKQATVVITTPYTQTELDMPEL